MQMKMYSVRDAKAQIYHPPYYKHTHGEAERDFRTLTNDEKSTLSQYPEDFDLYFLGEYDDQTGKMLPLDTPQHVIKAIDCKTPQQG